MTINEILLIVCFIAVAACNFFLLHRYNKDMQALNDMILKDAEMDIKLYHKLLIQITIAELDISELQKQINDIKDANDE